MPPPKYPTKNPRAQGPSNRGPARKPGPKPNPFRNVGAGVTTWNTRPPAPKAPARAPTRAPVAPPPEAEADRIIAELLAELGISRDSARREAENSAQQEMARAQALAQALTQLGIPQNVQNIYGNSAQAVGGLAQGFSGAFSGQAAAQAAEQSNMLAGTGQEGAVRSEGVGMGDVLYGQQGFIPARGLEQTGAAFASQAALQPGFALQFGQQAAADQIQDFIKNVLPGFTDKEAEIRTKRPSLVADAQERALEKKRQARGDTLDLYKAGLLTQREFAKRMGVPGWRKFPNTIPTEEQDRPKASASLSKVVGYLVNEFGEPLLTAKGKVIPLPKDPAKLERFGSASSGYWLMDPVTGEIQNILPPQAPRARAPRAPKGMQLKETDRGLLLFDPNTGRTTVVAAPLTSPKEKAKVKITAGMRSDAGSIADKVIAAFATNTRFSYQEALQLMAIQGVPPSYAASVLNRIWKKGGTLAGGGLKPKISYHTPGPGMPAVPYLHFEGEPVSQGRPLMSRAQIRAWQKKWKVTPPKAGPPMGGDKAAWLASLWVQAGGDPSVANVAAAIAIAESGGRVDAWNPNGRDKSAGLWQINYHGALRAPRTRQFGSPELLRKDPLANAKAAVAIYKSAGNSFSPWTTYTGGAYEKHLQETVLSPSGGPPSDKWDGSQSLIEPFKNLATNLGLSVTSEKRSTRNTASGGVSDHWEGSKGSYAYDLSGSVAKMDRAAKALMAQFGIKWNGGAIVKNFYKGGYRFQILYRTDTGGNHFDHIHIGMRRGG